MTSKYAFVEFHDKSHKTISLEQGIKMQKVLDCEVEPENEAQAAYVLNIKRIYLPPSVRSDRQSRKQDLNDLDIQDKMTNPGVQQGVNEQIPRGDR